MVQIKAILLSGLCRLGRWTLDVLPDLLLILFSSAAFGVIWFLCFG